MPRPVKSGEGHKETDEREVGTAFRQREAGDLPREGTHVQEESPRLRGHYFERSVEDASTSSDDDDT